MPTGMRVPQVRECVSARGGVPRAFALVCRAWRPRLVLRGAYVGAWWLVRPVTRTLILVPWFSSPARL
jgi:hypothetical protein